MSFRNKDEIWVFEINIIICNRRNFNKNVESILDAMRVDKKYR